ncbi:unnamed protein product [Amaranthus hypochondriacus]
MAPKIRKKIIKKTENNISTRRRRIVTRSIYKKEKLSLSQTTPKKKTVKSWSLDDDINGGNNISAINKSLDGVFSTPKSEKYKIPKIESCPPAPIKPTTLFSKRRSIIFFTNPEIDNFLMFCHG